MDNSTQLSTQLQRASELFSSMSIREMESDQHSRRRDHYRPRVSMGAEQSCVGPDALTIIDPPTSDEESDSERSGPNVRMVTEAILDSQMTKISVRITQDEFVPCDYQSPALIFFHLDSHMTSSDLFSVFARKFKVSKVHMVDFADDTGFSHCGIVYFKDALQGDSYPVQQLYQHLKVEEVNGTLGSRVHRIAGAQRMVNVKWIRNEVLSEQREWSAVVLRNLPANSTVEAVMDLLNVKGERPVVRIEPPRLVRGKYCTIAVTRNIEDAEKVCKRLNNSKLGSETLKVHVHPRSKGKRREDSHHKLFHLTSSNGKRSKSSLLEELICMFPLDSSKSVGPKFEEGEIPDINNQAYVPPAPVSKYYTLYEFPGVSYFPTAHRSHSGMHIMTTHTNDEGSPSNE